MTGSVPQQNKVPTIQTGTFWKLYGAAKSCNVGGSSTRPKWPSRITNYGRKTRRFVLSSFECPREASLPTIMESPSSDQQSQGGSQTHPIRRRLDSHRQNEKDESSAASFFYQIMSEVYYAMTDLCAADDSTVFDDDDDDVRQKKVTVHKNNINNRRRHHRRISKRKSYSTDDSSYDDSVPESDYSSDSSEEDDGDSATATTVTEHSKASNSVDSENKAKKWRRAIPSPNRHYRQAASSRRAKLVQKLMDKKATINRSASSLGSACEGNDNDGDGDDEKSQ